MYLLSIFTVIATSYCPESVWKSRKWKWNGNWKWKLETEMEAKHTPKYTLFSSGLMSSVLFHYSCILLSYGYMTGFMSLCFVITYLVWLTRHVVVTLHSIGQFVIHIYMCILPPQLTYRHQLDTHTCRHKVCLVDACMSTQLNLVEPLSRRGKQAYREGSS